MREQSAHWALFNVSADQHVLRCVRVTDAADTIVEICVVSGRGTSSIYLLLSRSSGKDRTARASRLHEHDARPDNETVERVRRGRRGVNSKNHQGPGS